MNVVQAAGVIGGWVDSSTPETPPAMKRFRLGMRPASMQRVEDVERRPVQADDQHAVRDGPQRPRRPPLRRELPFGNRARTRLHRP